MENYTLLEFATWTEPLVCIAALAAIGRRGQTRKYRFLCSFLSIHVIGFMCLWPLFFFAGRGLEKHLAYHLYIPIYWICYAIESMLALGIVYELYSLAMAPLRGLQRLGNLMFRWAAAISVAVSVGLAFGHGVGANDFLLRVVSQFQQTQSILTLCMLLFVTFAIRPMGLSYRSKIFGVSFGLGLQATSYLVTSAGLTHMSSMASVLNLVQGVMFFVSTAILTAYFILPEPKRRMIILPTTSPFLRWNQISLALGDEPGYVAIGGIDPEMLTPAELEVMRRASLKMEPVTSHS